MAQLAKSALFVRVNETLLLDAKPRLLARPT
jgi:hypothetical protein